MAPAWNADEAKALAGSTPVPSARVQGCAPGRAVGLQSRRSGFESYQPCLKRYANRLLTADSASSRMRLPVSWSSGVLATLTWWRSLVQIQPRLLYSRGPAATAAP